MGLWGASHTLKHHEFRHAPDGPDSLDSYFVTPADLEAAVTQAEAYTDQALTAYAALTRRVSAVKSATQPLTVNSVTPQDVADLVLPLAADRVYLVEGFIIADTTDLTGTAGGDATADLKFGFTGVNVTSFEWVPLALVSSATGTSGSLLMNLSLLSSTRTTGLQAIGTGKSISLPRGILIMGSSAGSVQLQASQGTAEAGILTNVYAHSLLTAVPLL